jgi:hypothetical protein
LDVELSRTIDFFDYPPRHYALHRYIARNDYLNRQWLGRG